MSWERKAEHVHYPQRTVESVEKYHSALCDYHSDYHSDYHGDYHGDCHSDITVIFHEWQKASDPDPQQEHFPDPGKSIFDKC